MSEPTKGQPYTAVLRFSVGDPDSVTVDSPAYRGVEINTAGVLPANIVTPTETFTMTTYLKGASAIGPWLGAAILGATVQHNIVDVLTGVVTVLAGGAIGGPLMAAPAGASTPPAGWADEWYSATSPATTLPAGTYRVMTSIQGSGGFAHWLAAFHEFIIMSS